MTDAELAEARELCEKATPGPWTTCGAQPNAGCSCGLVWAAHEHDTVARSYSAENSDRGRSQDAEFIAASRTLVPRLLDLVASLRTDLSQAVAACQVLGSQLAEASKVTNAAEKWFETYGRIVGESQQLLDAVTDFRQWKRTHPSATFLGTVEYRDGKLVTEEEK